MKNLDNRHMYLRGDSDRKVSQLLYLFQDDGFIEIAALQYSLDTINLVYKIKNFLFC